MKIIVKKDGELLDYLVNNIDMPRKKIKEYLTHGSIIVNNTKTTKYDYKVYSGNTIIINTKNNNKYELPFDIIYEDKYIIVVNKPSNLLTISTDNEKYNTLYHMVREYVKNINKKNRIFIVHRLDKNTSGVILFAKDEKTKNMLQDNWNEYVKERNYIAIVHGNVLKEEDTIINSLNETKPNLVYTTTKDKGKEAITHYKVLNKNKLYTALNINISTGRKNQIRVTLKELGNPILGDKIYGIKDEYKRLFLHANKLKIYYPYIKKDILFETKIPIEFKKIMKG